MKHAIAILDAALEALTTNEPINRAEGNTAQADLEAVSAKQVRQALAILNAAENGRPSVWGSAERIWMRLHESSKSPSSIQDLLSVSERELYEALTAKFTSDCKPFAF